MAINGTEYSFESIEVTLNGKLVSATGIKYGVKRDIQKKYVLGQSNARAIIKGAKDSTGELRIEHNELIRLQNSIPKGSDLTDIKSMTIIVKYQDEDSVIYTDRLEGVVFEEHPREFKAENPHFEITLPIHIGKIIYRA